MSKANNTLVELRDQADRILATVNAEKPSAPELAELRAAIAAAPALVEELGNLARQLRKQLIRRHGQPGMQVLLESRVTQMMRDLGYEQAPLLERMLIDHLIVCWLRWQEMEFRYEMARDDEPTIKLSIFWEKRLSAAQRRFLRASESLARVRRLAVRTPGVLQLNIGQQQVNTAS